MIIYNKLEIVGAKLIIDIETDTESNEYWADLDLECVRIDTSKTYGTKKSFEIILSEDWASIKTTISISGASDELFIVTPVVRGLPSNTPCGLDVPEIGVAYNKKKLAERGLMFLKELGDTCTIPKGFIDFILKRYALDMAIDTCNYSQAAKYYKMLMNNPIKATGSTCGCNK